MKKKQINFFYLLTDVCYMINGFIGSESINDESLIQIMNDKNQIVHLHIDSKNMCCDDTLTRLQLFALENVARDNDYSFDIFTKD